MYYFGKWPSSVSIGAPLQTGTPIGMLCNRCSEPIAAEDPGVTLPLLTLDESACTIALHRECYLRGIFGSLGHQQGRCSCYGGSMEDPPELTARQAARAAVVYFELVNRNR